MSPRLARRTFFAAEPIHAMIYFTPHFLPAYEAVGLRGRRMGYPPWSLSPVEALVTHAAAGGQSPPRSPGW